MSAGREVIDILVIEYASHHIWFYKIKFFAHAVIVANWPISPTKSLLALVWLLVFMFMQSAFSPLLILQVGSKWATKWNLSEHFRFRPSIHLVHSPLESCLVATGLISFVQFSSHLNLLSVSQLVSKWGCESSPCVQRFQQPGGWKKAWNYIFSPHQQEIDLPMICNSFKQFSSQGQLVSGTKWN